MKKYAVYAAMYLTTLAVLVSACSQHAEASRLAVFFFASFVLTFLSSPVTMKFVLFLILAPWHGIVQARRLRKNRSHRVASPLVSIIVPAWNEAVGIVPTVKTLLTSSYQNIEIVIVNDGSTDNSDSVIRTFIQKYELSMRGTPAFPAILYTYQANAGKGAALNKGISLSHGEIVVCIDADCLMSRDCILHFVMALQDPTIMAACGNIKVGNTQTLLSQIQMFEYAASFYSRKTDAILNTLYVISGAGGAYRREVFDLVGLYGVALRGAGEDIDLSIRVQQAGMKIAFVPEAIVYTEVPTSVRALAKQRLRWARSRFETFRTYSRFIFSTRHAHNKILTCFVIPLIIFNDWFYLLKMLLRISIYLFAAITHLYQLLAMFILVSMMVSGFPLWDNREYRKYSVLIPIQWLLTLIPSCIEGYAISLSLWGMLRNRDVTWQTWQRKGVIDT